MGPMPSSSSHPLSGHSHKSCRPLVRRDQVAGGWSTQTLMPAGPSLKKGCTAGTRETSRLEAGKGFLGWHCELSAAPISSHVGAAAVSEGWLEGQAEVAAKWVARNLPSQSPGGASVRPTAEGGLGLPWAVFEALDAPGPGGHGPFRAERPGAWHVLPEVPGPTWLSCPELGHRTCSAGAPTRLSLEAHVLPFQSPGCLGGAARAPKHL